MVRPAQFALEAGDRSEPAVVVPGRSPSSISSRLAQVPNASGFTSSCTPIRRYALVLVAGSFLAQIAIRVACSRSSTG